VFIYEATEHFARFLQAFAFPNVLVMARFHIVVNLLAAFHKLEKTVILIETGKEGQEFYLLGRINYIRIESPSIGIRSVICLTFGHILAEGGCQPHLAFYDH
jgi:hypothetical protein